MRWWEPSGKLRSTTHATKRAVNKALKEKLKELKGATVKAAEYEESSDKEKRYLYDLKIHAESQG